jgi:hypothetical protein
MPARRRLRSRWPAAVAAAGLCSCALVTPTAAIAASGNAYTSDTGDIAGHTYWDDRLNVYTVYDDDKDSEGVVGWIEVRQANGSWSPSPHVYVGTGYDTERSGYRDVKHEYADVRIWACRQNGASGKPYSCGKAIVPG